MEDSRNLSLLYDVYETNLLKNKNNISFWENYLKSLNQVDFNVFVDKLSVPILVPIGNKIFFRGELKHTNEITAAIGGDYFAKCSVAQAEVLRQHRIKDAKSKLYELRKERDFLQKQISFSKEVVLDDECQNIIEYVTEEEDKEWREKHRENVKQYKQRKDKSDEDISCKTTNDDIWERLDELELQEELENELTLDSGDNKCEPRGLPETAKVDDTVKRKPNDSLVNDKDNDKDSDDDNDDVGKIPADEINDDERKEIYAASYRTQWNIFQQPSKLELFEKVLERHTILKSSIAELRKRTKDWATSERDLTQRLHDLEQLDILEDELTMLEDMLDSDGDDYIEMTVEEIDNNNGIKKSVAFADVNGSDTFEISFRHSKVEPCKTPYDPKIGILKPSDIYAAHSSYFSGQTTSILKKPKCDDTPVESKSTTIEEEQGQDDVNHESHSNIIVVKDVVETVDSNDDDKVKQNERPMSLFKKRRQQQKE